MEQGKFKNNHMLFILGMICLVLCLVLFFLSIYILPFLLWQFDYNVPYFISSILNLFEEEYEFSERASKTIVWLIFFVPSIITGLVSYVVSSYIENQNYKKEMRFEEEQKTLRSREKRQERQESVFFPLKILGLMILCIFLVFLLQYLIQYS